MTDENTSTDLAPLTVTLKGGPGYEAPWVVARASSAGRIKELLEELDQAELFPAVTTAAATFHSAYGTSRPQPQAAASAPQTAVAGPGNGQRPPLTGQGQEDAQGRVWLNIPYGKHTAIKEALGAVNGKMFFKKEEAPDKNHVWYVQPKFFPAWRDTVVMDGKTLGQFL